MNTKLDQKTLRTLRDAFKQTAFGPHYNFRHSSRRGLMLGIHLPRRENIVAIRALVLVVARNMLAHDDTHAVVHEVVGFVNKHRIRLFSYIADQELTKVDVTNGKPEWPTAVADSFSLDLESISTSLRQLHPNAYNNKSLAVLIGDEASRQIRFSGAFVRCIRVAPADSDTASHFTIQSDP